MALPILKSLKDCVDYSQTVEPFIPQFYELPDRLLQTSGNLAALKEIYLETNPMVTAFSASLFLGGVFLFVSEMNKNYSQVDRMWSILPNLYIVHFAVWARMVGMPHSRLDLVAAFSTIWSCRLTFNYWRRGGYSVGSEDYRWEILKDYVPGFVFLIFNITFISFYQSILLCLFSAVPAYSILLSTKFQPDISTADLSYFAVEVAFVISEWFSDGQQWRYQTAKYKYRDDAKLPKAYSQAQLDLGFNTSGLWAYSRHPNFLAEQSIWFVLYQWSCYATNSLYSWTFAGSGLLILLFQGSTWLTEAITAGKYPEYADYRKQVGMFLPTSLWPYKVPVKTPTVIRTSELAKLQQEKEKAKTKAKK